MSDPHWQDVTVTDPDRLSEVEAQVHDCPFDPADVSFDEPARAVTVPFRRTGWDEEARVGGTPRVDDRAGIGEAELLSVDYDASASTMSLGSTPDTEIVVDVEACEVAVEHTDEVLGRGRRSVWFGLVHTYDHEVRPA